jgi:phosphate transport system substrate-binding protein
VAGKIAASYKTSCPKLVVTVGVPPSLVGTIPGLNALSGSGAHDRQAAASQIAMADGAAPAGYPMLVGTPIGVIIFTVVVNRQTGVYRLTTGDVRRIFSGAVTNWRQLGGADLPISIVSRYLGSGTRRAFDSEVLGGPELSASSFDCRTKNADPTSPVVLCDMPSTPDLLQNVAQIAGAMGYAETWDVEEFPGGALQPAELNNLSGVRGEIGTGTKSYHFWTVEYLYTYGTPPLTSPAAEFLNYMNSYAAKDILRTDGYIPCVDRQQNLMSTLCAPGT